MFAGAAGTPYPASWAPAPQGWSLQCSRTMARRGGSSCAQTHFCSTDPQLTALSFGNFSTFTLVSPLGASLRAQGNLFPCAPRTALMAVCVTKDLSCLLCPLCLLMLLSLCPARWRRLFVLRTCSLPPSLLYTSVNKQFALCSIIQFCLGSNCPSLYRHWLAACLAIPRLFLGYFTELHQSRVSS